MKTIWIWEIEPFEPIRELSRFPCFADLKDSIRMFGLLHRVIIARVGDRYKLLDGVSLVLAARAVGVYRIQAIVQEVEVC